MVVHVCNPSLGIWGLRQEDESEASAGSVDTVSGLGMLFRETC